MLNWSIRLFRIFGIQIAVHSTFLLLLGYYAWDGWKDAVALGLPGYEGMLEGGSYLLIFFVFVLLHELGHALAAKRYGIRVPRILLMPIGGMAQMESIPKSPRKEFVIAIAGPAVNFLIIGLIRLFIPFPTEQLGGYLRYFLGLPISPAVNLDMSWPQILMTMNIVMGCFNLIPVFPMDGGRVFRALLATRLPYVKATFVAATVAKVLAGLGILAALFWFKPPRYMTALLFAFIFSAGEAEYRSIRRRDEEEARLRQMLEELAARAQPIDLPKVDPGLS